MTRRIGGSMDYSKLYIASALRVHPEQVRRWLTAVEHSEAAAVHARAWKASSDSGHCQLTREG